MQFCINNYLESLKKHKGIFEFDTAFQYAAINGHLSVLKYLVELSNERNEKLNIHSDDDCAFLCAAENGHLSVLKYIVELSDERNEKLNIYYDRVFQYVAYYGHLSVLKYLVKLSDERNEKIDIYSNDEYAFRHAAENGHLSVLKYIVELSNEQNEKLDIHSDDEYAFKKSTKEIIDYLLSVSLQYGEFSFCINYIEVNNIKHHQIQQIANQRSEFQPKIRSSPTNIKFRFK